ncbi:MAG: antibiotic biosynthesis monooxygenase [Pyrinomonadaceae bacterium]|nr:antibiotic biosynthesis monooxygenase [Pyrinomonadaceae bacterium]
MSPRILRLLPSQQPPPGGWTSHDNAAAYQSLLETEILPGIASRQVEGYCGAHLLRRDLESEVEFVTILWFDSLDAVRNFAGEDHEVAVVPSQARALLSRFDDRSAHYKVLLNPR